jgi:hypothetical protein
MEGNKCNVHTKNSKRTPDFQRTGGQSIYHEQINGKMLYRQVYPALSYRIPDEQFAYLPRRDTTLQLLRFTEYVTDKFSERAYTAATSLDVSKAYEMVWTIGLICKVHRAGIPDSSLVLLVSCLTDPKFGVAVEGAFSDWKPIPAGIPQGAVLASLLYNIHRYT